MRPFMSQKMPVQPTRREEDAFTVDLSHRTSPSERFIASLADACKNHGMRVHASIRGANGFSRPVHRIANLGAYCFVRATFDVDVRGDRDQAEALRREELAASEKIASADET